MKKTVKFILAVLTAFCMLFAVACNSGDDNNNNNNQNQGGANAEVTRNEWHDALDFADITNYTCTLTYSKNGSDYTATVKRAGNDIYVTLADGSEQYFELVSGGAKKYVKANGSAEWTGEMVTKVKTPVNELDSIDSAPSFNYDDQLKAYVNGNKTQTLKFEDKKLVSAVAPVNADGSTCSGTFAFSDYGTTTVSVPANLPTVEQTPEVGGGDGGEENTGGAIIDYKFNVVSRGGIAIDGVTVEAYKNGSLVGSAETSKGVARITMAKDEYEIELSGVPMGYEVPEDGLVTSSENGTLNIILESSVIATTAPAGTIYEIGSVAYNFSYKDSTNVTRTLADAMEGKKAVMLNFWYDGCMPCYYEFPVIDSAYRMYSDKIEILALSASDSVSGISQYKANLGLTFVMGQDNTGVYNLFNVEAVPTTVMIDRYGVVSYIHTGSITDLNTWKDLFEQYVGDDYGVTDEDFGGGAAEKSEYEVNEETWKTALSAESLNNVQMSWTYIYDTEYGPVTEMSTVKITETVRYLERFTYDADGNCVNMEYFYWVVDEANGVTNQYYKKTGSTGYEHTEIDGTSHNYDPAYFAEMVSGIVDKYAEFTFDDRKGTYASVANEDGVSVTVKFENGKLASYTVNDSDYDFITTEIFFSSYGNVTVSLPGEIA